jgi:hypothetical protein
LIKIEGQIITWVLRTPPNGEVEGLNAHQEVDGKHVGPRPTNEVAQELGISLEQLTLATSKLRAPEDPILTQALIRELLKVLHSFLPTMPGTHTFLGI